MKKKFKVNYLKQKKNKNLRNTEFLKFWLSFNTENEKLNIINKINDQITKFGFED